MADVAGPWQLQAGEALVVTGWLPPCRFANVVLWNRYLQTTDYTRHPGSLNRHHLGSGNYTFVIAHQVPLGDTMLQYGVRRVT